MSQILFVSSFWVILSRCEVYFYIYLLKSNLFPAVEDLTDFWNSLCFAFRDCKKTIDEINRFRIFGVKAIWLIFNKSIQSSPIK